MRIRLKSAYRVRYVYSLSSVSVDSFMCGAGVSSSVSRGWWKMGEAIDSRAVDGLGVVLPGYGAEWVRVGWV